jgi:putative nucleotidyltransferase with HDIG domain
MIKKYDSVEEFIEATGELPALPENLTKLNEILENENSTAEDLAKIISTDQALAAKVLKIANSAFYGRVSQVVKISEAVVIIGLANIKNMIFSIFLEQLYGNRDEHIDILVSELWKHSLSTALMSSKIMERINPEMKETAYTAGLLHDIGELILIKNEKETYNNVLKEVHNEEVLPRIVVEESILGFSHADLGAALARKWSLPRHVRNGIFFHHRINDSEPENVIASVVYIADLICSSSGIAGSDVKNSGKPVIELAGKEISSRLQFNEKIYETYLEEMKKIKNIAEELMNSLKSGG